MFAMTSNRKGAIAEAAIALEASGSASLCSSPSRSTAGTTSGSKLAGRILRVQCKWGSLDNAAGTIRVSLQCSWLSPNGYVRSCYSEDEIDLVAVYCSDLDRCYLLPSALVAGRRESTFEYLSQGTPNGPASTWQPI